MNASAPPGAGAREASQVLAHLPLACLVLVTWLASGPVRAGTPPRDELSVVTLNLWHDQRDWPARQRMIVAGLRDLDADVICLQEVLQHETLPNQAATLAESLGCRFHFVSVDPEGAPRRYGNAILTRHPIVRAAGRFLKPLDDYRVVAHARIEVRGREVDVYDTHLHHTPAGGAIRAEQIRDLLAFVDSTRGGGALVLAGDFNAELGSHEMRPLEARFADAFAATHRGVRGAAAATMNPALGNAPRGIDHVFVPRGGPERLVPSSARILFREPGPGKVWASDHFGVGARLRFAGARR